MIMWISLHSVTLQSQSENCTSLSNKYSVYHVLLEYKTCFNVIVAKSIFYCRIIHILTTISARQWRIACSKLPKMLRQKRGTSGQSNLTQDRIAATHDRSVVFAVTCVCVSVSNFLTAHQHTIGHSVRVD